MAGKLRGKHTTVIDPKVSKWLLKYGDISPGFISSRTKGNSTIISIKAMQGKGWITVKIINGSNIQVIKYFHDQENQFPWDNGNIPESITKRYEVKNFLSSDLSDEEE